MRSVTSPTRAWREVVTAKAFPRTGRRNRLIAAPCSDKDGRAPELRTSRASPAPRLCQPLARFRPITRSAFAPKRGGATLLNRVGQSAEPKDVIGSDLEGNNDSRGG